MAFLKVVEGSQIYNFPIHSIVHFHSIFWRKLKLNRGTPTRAWPRVCSRAPPRRPAPATSASPSGPRAAPSLGLTHTESPRIHPLLAPRAGRTDGNHRTAGHAVPHGRASYRGRRLPLRTSRSLRRHQCVCACLLKARMLPPLDTPTPTTSCRRRPPWELLDEQRPPFYPSPSKLTYTSLGTRGSFPCRALPNPGPISPAFHRRRGGQCRARPSTPPPTTSTPSEHSN
jgi:hypothetical protein